MRKLAREARLETADEQRLAIFIAHQKHRVEAHQEHVGAHLHRNGARYMRKFAALARVHPELVRAMRRDYDAEYGTRLAELDTEEFIDHLPRMVPTRLGIFDEMSRESDEIAQKICELDWRFYVSSGEDFFALSGDPCLLFSSKPPDIEQVIMPLGRNLCFFAQAGITRSRGYYTARSRFVERVNSKTLECGTRLSSRRDHVFRGARNSNKRGRL